MKNKLFQRFALIWLILLVLFNVIVFVLPESVTGNSRSSGAFWVGYAFITAAFLGHLGCAWAAFRADSLTKLFYNMPLLTISYTGLILTLISGALCMVVPFFPVWLGVILCCVILAFTAIVVLKAQTAADIVQNTEARVKAQTSTMRELTAQAESLIYQAKSEEARAECQKVYEALRYSDPVSNTSLNQIDLEISNRMNYFTKSINTDDVKKAEQLTVEIMQLISERNTKCKFNKGSAS